MGIFWKVLTLCNVFRCTDWQFCSLYYRAFSAWALTWRQPPCWVTPLQWTRMCGILRACRASKLWVGLRNTNNSSHHHQASWTPAKRRSVWRRSQAILGTREVSTLCLGPGWVWKSCLLIVSPCDAVTTVTSFNTRGSAVWKNYWQNQDWI